ncbi:MAG: hypothetical protein PHE55_01470 [Methylococcaceae bacterium]|nr:hypothetical protein [Methylococcaceae bacterium]
MIRSSKQWHWAVGLSLLFGLGTSPWAVSEMGSTGHLPRDAQQIPGQEGPPPPGGMMPGADPFHLLMNSREVQADLGLTETQIRHLSRVDADFLTKMRESSASPEQMQQQMQEGQMKIAKVLSTEQLDRFKEIMFQIEAPCNLMREVEDLERLQLTPAQTGQVDGLCQGMWGKIRSLAEEAHRSQPNDPCTAMMTVRAQEQNMKSQIQKDIDQILTGAQKKIYGEMKGRPIHLPPMRPPACDKNS